MAYYGSIRHRLVSLISSWQRNRVYTSRRGLTRGLKRRGGLGFLPGGRDSAEDEFLRSLDLRGKVVYDIGGFHGLMTLYFAKHAQRVVTYEANPANVLRIWDNVDVNGFGNVLIRNIAIGAEVDGMLTIQFDPSLAGAGSGSADLRATMDSRKTKQFTLPVTTVDTEQERYGLPAPDFIKIDVEGMEYDCLRGLENTIERGHPEILIEIHGSDQQRKRKTRGMCTDLCGNAVTGCWTWNRTWRLGNRRDWNTISTAQDGTEGATAYADLGRGRKRNVAFPANAE